MKKIIKMISVMIICSCFLTTANSSKAFISPNEDVAFGTQGKYQEICYQGESLCIPFAIGDRMPSREIIPIYNLKREKNYLTGGLAYYSKIDKIVNNDKVRRILLLGYPNVSFQELGCTDEKEAYIITQIAILNVYYQYNLNDFTTTSKNLYPNILNNLRNLILKANNATEVYRKPKLTIDDESIEWQKEENQDSKTYKVISNLNFENYTVEIQGENAKNIKVVDEQNEIRTTFLYNEKFKVILPNIEDVNFTIQVTAEFETVPVREGNALNEEWESYVILDSSELVTDSLKQVYTKVTTDIEENPKPDVGKPSNPDENETVTETQLVTNKKLPMTGF